MPQVRPPSIICTALPHVNQLTTNDVLTAILSSRISVSSSASPSPVLETMMVYYLIASGMDFGFVFSLYENAL